MSQKISCVKCGREKEFSSPSQIWTEGWTPVDKDRYVCDLCPEAPRTDEFDFFAESNYVISDPDEINQTRREKAKQKKID